MRLSIIVPAYKVEKYIEKCIRTLEDQDISKDDFEIIVTNDGSPDRSKQIVEKLQSEFPNIILINQENQGVSMARNNAIAKATGKYIMPVDPDDYVVSNTFKNILEAADAKELDIYYLGYEIFDSEAKSVWQTNFSQQQQNIYDGVEGYFAFRGEGVRDPDHSCGILFRKAMIDAYEISYPKNVPFLEDGLFLGKAFAVAKKVSFSTTPFYQRTTIQGSATVSDVFYSDKAINGFITSVKDIQSFSEANQLEEKQKYLINHIIAKYVFLALTPSISSYNLKQYFRTVKTLKLANLGKLDSRGARLIYPKYVKMYNFSKALFPLYFRFVRK
jgi:glycosyltransferase involved in cell wall biosynthesis